MGAKLGGGPSYSGPSLKGNIAANSSNFPFNKTSGLFGKPGKGKSRVIESTDPDATAKDFFTKLSKGAKITQKGGGTLVGNFGDGSSVFYRPNSKSGGPAVNIKIKPPANASQKSEKPQRYKIHFEPIGSSNETGNK